MPGLRPAIEPDRGQPDRAAAMKPEPSPVPVESIRTFLEALPLPAWLADGDGAIEESNDAGRGRIGVRPDVRPDVRPGVPVGIPADVRTGAGPDPDNGACSASNWFDALHPDDRIEVRANWLASDRSAETWQVEARVSDATGQYRVSLIHARPVRFTPGGEARWCFTATDIQLQVDARDEQARRATLRDEMLDVSVDCIKIIDSDGKLIHINRQGCFALGLDSSEAAFGRRWLDLLPAEVRASGQRALNRARTGKPARFAGKSVLAGHKPQYWDNILTPVLDDSGRVNTILCVSRDVTAQRLAQDRLRVASEQDSLTDLLNRRSLKHRINRAVNRARQAGGQVGLLLLDLDHFKNVNDTLGHGAGDHLLRVLSRRLRTNLPRSAAIGRLGGDEFAVLVEEIDGQDELTRIAEIMLRQIAEPIHYSGRVINGGMSIGGALFPRDAWDTSGLMGCADTALNDLKNGGRGGVRIFSERMTRAAHTMATQLTLARQLIRDQAVEPHYQPKVRLEDGSVIGFEALLRWRTADGELGLPGAVVEAFKDYELATGLAGLIHDGVLADMAAWRDLGLPLLPISINAAPVEFLRDDFATRLLRRLKDYRIPPELIEIEVTEHILLERGAECVANALRILKSRGVRISLDDFGTGHSSFAHLRDFPVDNVKIDRSFVSRMIGEPTILAIVEAMSRLGPALSIDVIAEGIETEHQRKVLLGAECQFGQGFLFGKAMSAGDVTRRLVELQTGNWAPGKPPMQAGRASPRVPSRTRTATAADTGRLAGLRGRAPQKPR